ncbi:hypothetical protein SLOPH_583 [Spraguea lophii 42_110]|uniref:Uncharacterized protein n=1 Tax=Spraguea lophii (strain 42_110) TaxID=1358809 RepID=S7W598_SPRLO|nr:hypothetical protein SLOPH_583 [Spraguea lophii 42_110]
MLVIEDFNRVFGFCYKVYSGYNIGYSLLFIIPLKIFIFFNKEYPVFSIQISWFFHMFKIILQIRLSEECKSNVWQFIFYYIIIILNIFHNKV